AANKRMGPLTHTGPIHDVAFSADGSLIVTACVDHYARVWNASTGQAVSPEVRHPAPFTVLCAALSPDNRLVVTGCADGLVRLWDAESGKPVPRASMAHGTLVSHVCFSPDGKSILSAGWDHTARVWNAATGEPVTPPLRHSHMVRTAAFSRAGDRI